MRFAAVSGNFSVALFCWKGESLTLQFRVIIPEKLTGLEAFLFILDFSSAHAQDP